ncbi:hypothetical protein EYF80_013686 [Liparis tanakae]|uniref:Uncharacterized protein n=1 Tax=Liparis tanakae TaxID=230148 RepID=A0A4Z2IEY5_9TELE|nr:hypothetical protein EYF80_013686 [Liparis tanakae]
MVPSVRSELSSSFNWCQSPEMKVVPLCQRVRLVVTSPDRQTAASTTEGWWCFLSATTRLYMLRDVEDLAESHSFKQPMGLRLKTAASELEKGIKYAKLFNHQRANEECHPALRRRLLRPAPPKVTQVTQALYSPEEPACPLEWCSRSDACDVLSPGCCSPRSLMSHFDARCLLNAAAAAVSPESASTETSSCEEEGRSECHSGVSCPLRLSLESMMAAGRTLRVATIT